jgi:bifunctional non-homologous end joining protein LigD
MLATKADHLPTGEGWSHEVKWDGVRILADVRAGADGRARLFTRNGNDASLAWPDVHLSPLGDRDLLVDGEVIGLNAEGLPDFSVIQERMHVRSATTAARLADRIPATYMVFDLLRLDSEDLTDRPLSERRELLAGLGLSGTWQVPESYDDGAMLFDATRQQGLEGIVSKRLSSRYRPGVRSKDWLKFPIRPTGSYVVGGYRHEVGTSNRLGAVLVGQPTATGLSFRGRVGSGIAGKAGRLLGELLTPHVVEESPFDTELPRLDRQGTVWVEPFLVVDVQYLRLTNDGRLRQPAYRGVRTDLTPSDLE